MVCPNCGFNNKDGAKNCSNCGYLLVKKKVIHINYIMLIGCLIVAILVGEVAYLLGGEYHTSIENKKVIVKDEVQVLTVKDDIDINSPLDEDDILFIKIPKKGYNNKMVDKDSYQEGLCAKSALIKDTIIYKEQLGDCNINNGEIIEEGFRELVFDNNFYGLKKNSYVDLYISLVNDGELMVGKIFEGLKVIRVDDKISVAIPNDYYCLFSNASKLSDVEIILNVSHTKESKLSNNYLRNILDTKTKDMGCSLDEE